MSQNTACLNLIPLQTSPRTAAHHTGLADHFSYLSDHAVRLRFHRSDKISAAGDTASHVYVVNTGCVRLTHTAQDGRRHIADFLFAGDVWGLGDIQVFSLTAEAVSPSTVTAYPRAQFEHFGEGNSRLREDVLTHLAHAIARAHQHHFLLSRLTARERIATFLIRMLQNSQLVYGSCLDLPMGRRDIADHLGLTIETVCRTLAALRRDGIVETPNAHQIVVRDSEALHAIPGNTTLH